MAGGGFKRKGRRAMRYFIYNRPYAFKDDDRIYYTVLRLTLKNLLWAFINKHKRIYCMWKKPYGEHNYITVPAYPVSYDPTGQPCDAWICSKCGDYIYSRHIDE